MKNIFLKLGLLTIIVTGVLFGTQANFAFAEITETEGEGLLAYHNPAQWGSMSRQEQMTRASIYTASINQGFTDYQAGRSSTALYQSMNAVTPSAEMDSIMVSDIPGVSWHYNNTGFRLSTTNEFEPVVPVGDRTYTNTLNQINSNMTGADNDSSVDNSGAQSDVSQEQDNPTSNGAGTTAINSGARSTAGTTACAQEGLDGVDFLVFHGPLVPCGINKHCSNGGDRENDITVPCTLCHFIILIKNVFDLLLSLIITASLFMLTVAGVMYIVSSGGQLTGMAKGIIEKTLLGFGVFLLSWLLVYTLLNMLSVRDTVVGKGSRATWFQFECDTESKFYMLPESEVVKPNPGVPVKPNPGTPVKPSPGASTKPTPGQTSQPISSDGTYNNSEARKVLGDAGVNIKNGVKVDGLQKVSVDGLNNFNRQCNSAMSARCETILTAGLDGAHKTGTQFTHANGYKTDIRSRRTTPNMNKFLVGTSDTSQVSSIAVGSNSGYLTRVGTRKEDGAILFKDPQGHPWALENQNSNNEHWDINWGKKI